jgi:ribosome-associated protein
MTQSDDQDLQPPSKSQRKREMHALQRLGTSLVALSRPQLEELGLPLPLLEAVLTAQTMRSHGALRRQLQYIGKLMRSLDPLPIQQALARIQAPDRQAAARLHRLERLRDTLINEGDAGIGRLTGIYPDADRQRLRQLIREARDERARGAPPHASRRLFRYLRELSQRG